MDFSCDRCGKRYSTDVEPVPGRVYRIPCRCGSTIIVQKHATAAPAARVRDDEPDTTPRVPFPRLAARGAAGSRPEPLPAPPPHVASSHADEPIADDPFVPAPRGSAELRVMLASPPREVTPTQVRPPLARRDPDAADDVSGPFYGPESENPFVDELRRTRARALALGAGVGAPVGALLALAMVAVVARLSAAPPPLPPEPRAAPEPIAVAVAAPAPAAPAPVAPKAVRAPAPRPAAVVAPSRRAAPDPAAPPRHAAEDAAFERRSSPPDPLDLGSGVEAGAGGAPPVEVPAAREESVEPPAPRESAPGADREEPADLDRPQREAPEDPGELER